MRPPRNSFDLIRVVAAAMVIVAHSFPISGDADPLHPLLGITLGTLGLLVFFGLSGYLVTGSWLSAPRVGTFAFKRALRILPALWASAAVTALVLGPAVTTLGAGSYMAHSQTYLYVLREFVLDTAAPHLPGVFEGHPLAGLVNGSVWTIPLEVACYGAVLVAGATRLLRRPALLIAVLALVVVALLVGAPPDDPHGHTRPGVEAFLNALRPCAAFLSGALLRVVSQTLRPRVSLGAICLAVTVLPVSTGAHTAIDVLAVPYAVVAFGSLAPRRLGFLLAAGDVSYGMYLYAFPIQQLVYQLWHPIGAAAMTAVALPAAWFAGLASWRLLERPTLALKRRAG